MQGVDQTGWRTEAPCCPPRLYCSQSAIIWSLCLFFLTPWTPSLSWFTPLFWWTFLGTLVWEIESSEMLHL